jgi:hypothetical protein
VGHFGDDWLLFFAAQLVQKLPQPHLQYVINANNLKLAHQKSEHGGLESEVFEHEVVCLIELYVHLSLYAVPHPTVTHRTQLLLIAFCKLLVNELHLCAINQNAVHESAGLWFVVGSSPIFSDNCHNIFELLFFAVLVRDIECDPFEDGGLEGGPLFEDGRLANQRNRY